MKFNVNQQDLQQALNYCQGVIEKRSTLPILSNILLDVSNSKLGVDPGKKCLDEGRQAEDFLKKVRDAGGSDKR